MTATPEPTLSTDAAETAESAAPENVGGLSGHELLSRTAVVVVSYDSATRARVRSSSAAES